MNYFLRRQVIASSFSNKHEVLISPSTLNDGAVDIPGFKHSLVSLLAISLVTNGRTILRNVPQISDASCMLTFLQQLGATLNKTDDTAIVDCSHLTYSDIPQDLSSRVHGFVYFIPAMLARFGKVNIGHIGGCQLGSDTLLGRRPIHHVIQTAERFGAHFFTERGRLIGHCPHLRACEIDIRGFSNDEKSLIGPCLSGATKTALILAACCKGERTLIKNPYRKGEISELLSVLQQSGCTIVDHGDALEISAPSELNSFDHILASDAIAVITWVAFAIHHGITLTLNNLTVPRLQRILNKELEYLQQMGVVLKWGTSSLQIPKRSAPLNPINLDVTPTGIYSDSQPFFTLMLLSASGISHIHEYVWPNRFTFATELKRLGARIKIHKNSIAILPSKLSHHSGVLSAHDLRSAAVLMIAASQPKGDIIVEGVEHLDRGYSNFLESLEQLGVRLSQSLLISSSAR